MTRKRTTENELVVSGAASAPRRKVSRPRSMHAAAPVETTPAPAPETIASETTSSVTAAEPSAALELVHEQIARLAYSYWEARGYQGGSPEEDWLRAEEEIRSQSVVVL